MEPEEIDWDRSIEQRIEEIIVAIGTARRLVRQIRRRKEARPELITDENYAYFQSVIHSLGQLTSEVEKSPLYERALQQLRNREKKKQRRTIAKYFKNILS